MGLPWLWRPGGREATEVTAELTQDRCRAMQRYSAAWQNSRFKLAAIATLLAFQDHAAVFESGTYEPLMAAGPNAEQIIGFLRRGKDGLILTAAARYPARLAAEGIASESAVLLPEALQNKGRDIVSGTTHISATSLRADELFALLPAVVLIAE